MFLATGKKTRDPFLFLVHLQLIHLDQLVNRFWCSSCSHCKGPRSRVPGQRDVRGGTIWQDAACHVGSLALPMCEWPDASQPNPLLFSWDRAAQVAMETCGLWLPRGEAEERDGSQVTGSNKSDRSQRWSGFGFSASGIKTPAWVMKRWPVTYWSALTGSKRRCKSRHHHDEQPTI